MKQRAHFLAFGAIFLCSLLLGPLFTQTVIATQEVIAADTVVNSAPVIILDAGHGGEDGGASGTNGVTEKDLNLSLTRTLADLMRGAGYTVVETRTEDKLLYDEGTKKGHKKQGDLENRLAFTETYPNSVFISIHMNTFPTADCRGLQVWYSQNDTESLAWAKSIQEKVQRVLQGDNHRKVKAATSSIYLLRHAKTPAILVECGFLSTPDECKLLCSEDYRKALALTLFAAICEKMEADSCETATSVL